MRTPAFSELWKFNFNFFFKRNMFFVVRALTPFTLMVFFSQYLVSTITKKDTSYRWFWDNNHSKKKIQMRQKKPGQILIWHRFLNWKKLNYWQIKIIFKIGIFQLIAKILLKHRSLNQVRHCLTGHIQIWRYFFIIKY